MNSKLKIAGALLLSPLAFLAVDAQAQSFDAPGSHTYKITSGKNIGNNASIVPSTPTNHTTNAPNILYGRDWLLGGRTSLTFGSAKAGFIPLNVGNAITSCASGTCSSTVSVTSGSCTIQQTTYGLDASTSLPALTGITLSYQSMYQTKACSSQSVSTTATISSSNFPSGYKLYPVIATSYWNATAGFKGTKIYFSPAFLALGDSDSKWSEAYSLCLSQGWSGGSSLAEFRQVVRYAKNCYVPSNTLVGSVAGPQPRERVSITVKVASSSSAVGVGKWFASSSY
ncbi:MAG: hypothetical protein ACTHOH_06895 [Lysobacteraceae bacterium]